MTLGSMPYSLRLRAGADQSVVLSARPGPGFEPIRLAGMLVDAS